MKKIFCLITLVAVLATGLSVFAGCADKNAYGRELLSNGDFEEYYSEDGKTELAWHRYMEKDVSADGRLELKSPEDGTSANRQCLRLTNKGKNGNYVRIYQDVAVEKGGVYRITARLRNEQVTIGEDEEFTGAGLEITESGTVLKDCGVETGEWVDVTAYVRPRNTEKLTISLTFGRPGKKASGSALYDDVSVVRMKPSEVPDGFKVINIVKPREAKYPLFNKRGTLLITLGSIFTVLAIGVFYFLFRRFSGDDRPVLKKYWITALAIGISAAALRLVLAGTAFGGRAAFLLETVREMVDNGGSRVIFNHPDLAPFQCYYYWIIGKIVYGWKNLAAVNVMAHLFPALCEGVTAAVLYVFSRKYSNDRQSALVGGLYAVLPLFLTASAGLGTELPVLVMLFVLTACSLVERDFISVTAFSLVSCLWSGYGIFVLPFIVLYEICTMAKTKDRKSIITICVSWFCAFWLFLFLSAPAVKDMFRLGHIVYVFKPYYLMLFDGQLCVSNAFNIYSLFGLNGDPVNKTAFWLNVVFVVILLVYTCSLYFRNCNRAELLLLTGFFLTVAAVFCLDMNETALAAGLIFLLMYVAVSGEERLFWVFGLFSLLAFADLAAVMSYSGALGSSYAYTFFADGDAGYATGSTLAGLCVLAYGWFVYDVASNGKRVPMRPFAVADASAKVPKER